MHTFTEAGQVYAFCDLVVQKLNMVFECRCAAKRLQLLRLEEQSPTAMQPGPTLWQFVSKGSPCRPLNSVHAALTLRCLWKNPYGALVVGGTCVGSDVL